LDILHTTDLHFNKTWFDWIAKQQAKFDVFCISGDFLDSSSDIALSKQILWIQNWIKKFDKPLFTCSGNHDIEELNNEDWLSNIYTSNYYSDYSIKTIGNIKFGCYPYIGAEGYYEFDECDILLAHIPPANTKTSQNKDGDEWGDKEFYRIIKNKIINPKIILCGHMHHPLKIIDKINSTLIYNTGVDKNSKIPNRHIIQT